MSNELSIIERARQAIAITQTEQELTELAAKSADVTEIKDDADYELVKRSALVLRDVRVDIQKKGKVARDDANAFSKAVIAESARLVNLISPEEERLKALRKEVDDKLAEELAEKRRAEDARVQEISTRIQQIVNMADGLAVASAAEIRERLEAVENIATTEEFFAEFSDEATKVREGVADALEILLAERVQFEEQKAEQERIAKEQAERQAELDRQAEEQAETARKAREEQEARDAAAEAERQEKARKAQEEKDRELAEERADAAAEKAERERLEGELQIRKEAEEKAAAEEAERERIAAAMPDIEKVERLARELQGYVMPALNDPACAELAAIALERVEEIGNVLLSAAGKLKRSAP